jgi:hypothetical protein
MLNLETAKRLFEYLPMTGELIWKVNLNRCDRIGKMAGYTNNEGYRRIQIYGKDYKAHRIVYLLHHGVWPSDHIDHINSNRSDNRIENLRVVNNKLNTSRRKKPINNTSGFIGVCYISTRNLYVAQIGVNNKILHLGGFAPLSTIPDNCPNLKIKYPDGIPVDSNLNKLYCFALYCDAAMTHHGFEYSTLQQYMYPDKPTAGGAFGAPAPNN